LTYVIALFFVAATAIKFANDERNLLAFSSQYGVIAICQLNPEAKVVAKLEGHTGAVTGTENLMFDVLKLGALVFKKLFVMFGLILFVFFYKVKLVSGVLTRNHDFSCKNDVAK